MDFWEKLQKRSEINRKIGELKDQIYKVQRIKNEIERVKRLIDSENESWETEYDIYKSSSLAEDIMMVNHFEGLAAEQLAGCFPDEVNKINVNAGKTAEVSAGIDHVLSAIDKYIELLNAKIAALRDELAGLDW